MPEGVQSINAEGQRRLRVAQLPAGVTEDLGFRDLIDAPDRMESNGLLREGDPYFFKVLQGLRRVIRFTTLSAGFGPDRTSKRSVRLSTRPSPPQV